MKIRILTLLAAIVTLVSCEDFLEKPPLDELTDETYWSSENNVRSFSWGFYTAYFSGYGSGYAWGDFFSGQSLNDDFGPTSPSQFRQNIPTGATSSYWTFAWVRKANIFLERIQTVPMDEEAINHWSGVARFFRAMEYHDLVKQFGDVPWYDHELDETNEEDLYRPRDPREFVMDRVLEDLQFAADNVRQVDGDPGLSVNRDVVLAFMSRIMLFEGTWQKYHEGNTEKAQSYLEAAKWAANEIISAGNYSLDDYREVFTSLNLSGNPEVILYRHYEPGLVTHALNSYNNKEPQTGVSKDAVESYLASDGLPINISPLYQGDKGIGNVMANRDGRVYGTLVTDELRLNGILSNYSTTGYATLKFLNEEIKDDPEGSSNLNYTDSPVMRYGEVLMNYAEAVVELATVGGPAMTQADLDMSINVLRDRPGVGMPHLTLVGNEPGVNGVAYDDPERDPDVPSLIWEIRRERRIELMMEGFRLDDLKRWEKLEYSDTEANEDINRGAWIDKADYPDLQSSVTLTDGETGYIIPATAAASQRRFEDPKVYLDPVPLDQITLYDEHGVTLEQNPGWEQ
ncbi:RagB/SusD family nutrient uptake outer membrane protein [Echinicola strongylocentroti]|uniref:RagB/SusD family nutrient uptake outer membrane protein n=1 Tax=Echinicola strongylocentroti TaxID=1795355 RepID=A0A2Z4IKL1_9BACT|nr:RagB/SusD family nutrient uptake outer membrane protein [Echinicola strongylocentroti]AWW31475.1 RagB/SusD family nutrient uptake outer membrane protein [Echinicola strongylocentroti]